MANMVTIKTKHGSKVEITYHDDRVPRDAWRANWVNAGPHTDASTWHGTLAAAMEYVAEYILNCEF